MDTTQHDYLKYLLTAKDPSILDYLDYGVRAVRVTVTLSDPLVCLVRIQLTECRTFHNDLFKTNRTMSLTGPDFSHFRVLYKCN